MGEGINFANTFFLGKVRNLSDERMMMCVYHSGDKRRAEIVFSEMVSVLDLIKLPIISPTEGSFDETVKPYFDKSEFVVFLLTQKADNDNFLTKVFTECNNINKKVIPVNVFDTNLSLSRFQFRSDIVNYTNVRQKLKLMDQMRAWLGIAISNENVKCPHCGKTVRNMAMFCKWCGNKIK